MLLVLTDDEFQPDVRKNTSRMGYDIIGRSMRSFYGRDGEKGLIF